MKHWITFAWHFLLSLLFFSLAVEDFEQAIAGEDVRWNLCCGLTSFALSVSFYLDERLRRVACCEDPPAEEAPPEDAQPAEHS